MNTCRSFVLMGLCFLLFSSSLWAAFCIKCGKKMGDESKFCPACGHKAGQAVGGSQVKSGVKIAVAPTFRPIEEADNYYDLATKERESTAALVLPNVKSKRYHKALKLYQDILDKWPTSDKCELSAFWAGQIYESTAFKDWNQAIRYYRMVIQINPMTIQDVRYRIAVITEEDIKDFKQAEVLYEECILHARSQTEKEKAAKALRKLKEKKEAMQQRLSP